MLTEADDLPELAAPPAPEGGVQSPVPSLDAPAPAGGAVSEWNGERESLATQPWWNEIPESVRGTIERGIATKYTHFHRGADQARQAAAAKVADLEKKLADTAGKSDYWSKLLAADDAVAPLTEKVASLEAALAERDTKLADYENQVSQAETDRKLSLHEAKYPDIFADFTPEPDYDPASGRAPQPTGAYADFIKLTNAGIPEERAAKMVRAMMEPAAPVTTPAPVVAPPPARVVLPPSVAGMSNGAGPSPAKIARETNEDYDSMMLRKRREAEMDDEG